MIDFEDGMKLALTESYRLQPIDVPVTDGIGRILAETVFSPVNLPPFSKALVDGYAVFSEDAKDKKAIHEVIGSIPAGSFPTTKIERGQAMEVQAEAPIPKGSDAVVPHDYVRVLMDGARVGILKKMRKLENVVAAGEKLKKDEKILDAGTCLNGTEICLLTMAGIADVKIFPPPRVGVLSIGNELVEVGKRIKRGQVWDANGLALLTSLFELGTQPEYLGTVPQNFESLTKAITKAKPCNILIITGVVDKSRKEILVKALRELGVKFYFNGIAVQPYKSLAFAKSGQTLIFMMPEDGFSILTAFETMITPVLRHMMGFDEKYRSTLDAILESRLRKNKEYHLFQPAIVYTAHHKIYVKRFGHLGKSDLFSFSKCNALMSIPKTSGFVKKGKPVKVIMLKPFCELVN